MLHGNWNYPTSVKFGAGRIRELPDVVKVAGIKRPLLVTDPGLAKLPMVMNAVRANEAAGVPTLRVKLIATALSGAFMGMAGALFPYYIGYVEPATDYASNATSSGVTDKAMSSSADSDTTSVTPNPDQGGPVEGGKIPCVN